jgi:hypothetical protein
MTWDLALARFPLQNHVVSIVSMLERRGENGEKREDKRSKRGKGTTSKTVAPCLSVYLDVT